MDSTHRRVPISTTIGPRAHDALTSIGRDLDLPRSQALDMVLHIARRVLDAKCEGCDRPPLDASEALQRYLDTEIRRMFEVAPVHPDELPYDQFG